MNNCVECKHHLDLFEQLEEEKWCVKFNQEPKNKCVKFTFDFKKESVLNETHTLILNQQKD